MAITSTHSPLLPLLEFKRSKARWAVKPCGQAIIFIHGFSGSAVGTWKSFDEMLPANSKAEGVDIFFYTYTWFSTIRSAADRFFFFLNILNEKPERLTVPSVASLRTSFIGYKSILICAHSLGGVVTRYALLSAHGKELSWADKISTVLFAPAQIAIANSILTRFGTRLALPVCEMLALFPLRELQYKTEVTLKNKTSHLLIPKVTVHAEYERWVQIGTFKHDPLCVIASKATHTSVCKPTPAFMLPMELSSPN